MGEVTLGRYSNIFGELKNRFPVSNLIVGQFTSIAPGLTVMLGGNHAITFVTTTNFVNLMPERFAGLPSPFSPMGLTNGDIVIDHDVWVGENVTILSGIHISSGAIVGATATVSKNVPPYAVVVGNPGRIVKYRFPQDIIDRLLKIAWWDWSIDKIHENYSYFVNPDIELFVNTFDVKE